MKDEEVPENSLLKAAKKIKTCLLNGFAKETLEEYVELFEDACRQKSRGEDVVLPGPALKPNDLSSVYNHFFTNFADKCNQVALGYLNVPSSSFTEVQACLHLLHQGYAALSDAGPSFQQTFRQDVFQKVLQFHFEHVETCIYEGVLAIDMKEMASKGVASSGEMIDALTGTMCEQLSAVKVAVELFPALAPTIEKQYEKTLAAVFKGCLEVVQARLTHVKPSAKSQSTHLSGMLEGRDREQVSGQVLYFMSRVTREINFQSIF